MFTKCIVVFVAFFCYMLLTHGQNAKVPYEFCKGVIKVDALYEINTTSDSIFLTANEYRTILWDYTTVKEHCNKTMLEFTVARTIKYESDVNVFYYTMVSVKKSFRYNISNEIGQCNTTKTCYSAILQVVKNTSGLTAELTLNISGSLFDPNSQYLAENMPDCNNCKASCPQGSKETNMECECIPGTYLDVNLTECVLCPRNTYQEESGKFTCTPCPPQTTTVNRNGSMFRSNCSSACLPGAYLDSNLTECVLCPRNTYQDMSGKFTCKLCPKGTSTGDRNGSISRSNCSECSSGTYYDIITKTCMPCPKDYYQNLNGSGRCELCPDGKITSDVGAKSLNDCEKSPTVEVLAIVLPIVAIVVLLILALVVFIVRRKRRNRKLRKRIFRENFEEFVNPYYPDESSDEERNVEQCTPLGSLEPEVQARNLEIPRDCIKLTGVRLGRGNFGEVNQVLVKRDGEPEVLCAAKMARGSRVSLEDMLDELDIHLKLEKNPNIVNLVGVCSSSDGPFYLIVEYCGNGGLNDYLKEHKATPHYVNKAARRALSLEWKLQRTLEICNGMKFLSSQKIVHRDLAARNILLDHNTVAKVSDFGMAKDVYVKSYYKQRHEGSFPLRWMAIEAIQDLSFNEKTDIWSYGILVWEIFTEGKLPYYAIISDEKVANYILSGKKLKRPPECPRYLYRIMSKCWKDKDYNRPKFRELYEELDRTIKNEEGLNPDRRTNRGSFKKRFTETKRSVSRKLSWRRPPRTSQASTTIEANTSAQNFRKRASRQNSLDIDANISLENVSEDSEVTRDKLNRENTDGITPRAVSEDSEETKMSTSCDEKENGVKKSGKNDVERGSIHESNSNETRSASLLKGPNGEGNQGTEGVGNSKTDSEQVNSLNESSKDDQEMNKVNKLKKGHGSSCESKEASSLKKSKKDDQRMKSIKSKPDPCEPSVLEETSKNNQIQQDSNKELNDESSKASFLKKLNENDEDYGQNVENSETDSYELMDSVLRALDKNDHELGSVEKSKLASHESSKASPLKELNNEDQERKDVGKDEVDTCVNTKGASQGLKFEQTHKADSGESETADSATQECNLVDSDIEDESNNVSQEIESGNLESDDELGVLNEGLSIELTQEDNEDTSSA